VGRAREGGEAGREGRGSSIKTDSSQTRFSQDEWGGRWPGPAARREKRGDPHNPFRAPSPRGPWYGSCPTNRWDRAGVKSTKPNILGGSGCGKGAPQLRPRRKEGRRGQLRTRGVETPGPGQSRNGGGGGGKAARPPRRSTSAVPRRVQGPSTAKKRRTGLPGGGAERRNKINTKWAGLWLDSLPAPGPVLSHGVTTKTFTCPR